MTDLHIHTKFSPDGEAVADEFIELALLCNSSKIGFSEHFDLDYKYNNFSMVETNIAAYSKYIDELRLKYQNRIEIFKGIEIGYAKRAEKEYIETLKKFDFDYVINSLHVPEGETDCYFLPYFASKDKQERYKKYFESVLVSLESKIDYQIVGHLGYVSRNAPYIDPKIYYEDFSHIIDEILKVIIEREVALELNTNTKTAGYPFLPHTDILKRYKELGGENIVISSDAHQVRRLYDKFEIAIKAAKELGFDKTCIFRKGKKFYREL